LIDSKVTIKNPEGQIIQVKFIKTPNLNGLKKDANGITYVYERSPLAMALLNKPEGEICQLGMLEIYYEILKIE